MKEYFIKYKLGHSDEILTRCIEAESAEKACSKLSLYNNHIVISIKEI